MALSLTKIFNEGPDVSFKGSPTVSPKYYYFNFFTDNGCFVFICLLLLNNTINYQQTGFNIFLSVIPCSTYLI